MNKNYFRVLSIRRHKNITFINVYCNYFGIIQCMADNEIIKDINCGDLIECNIINDKNNKGKSIIRITKINKLIKCSNFPSYKGITNEIDNQELDNYLNSRNCGNQLKILKFKRELLNEIKNILNESNYFEATGLLNTVENYTSGSNIEPAIIQNRNINQPKYLRITMENQLKQITATLLKSSYAIEKVYRNMGEDASHINEFLMLELISIDSNMEKMLEFIKKIDNLVKIIGKNNDIIIPEKELKVIDYSELNAKNYDLIRKGFTNTIVLNFPCESPYIQKDENGKRKEVRWYVNGHWIGHYYQDEFEYENVKEILKIQNENTNKENINPMSYFEWGLPPTISLGLSIDRWLQMLMDLNNINSIANPISLDYKRRIRI